MAPCQTIIHMVSFQPIWTELYSVYERPFEARNPKMTLANPFDSSSSEPCLTRSDSSSRTLHSIGVYRMVSFVILYHNLEDSPQTHSSSIHHLDPIEWLLLSCPVEVLLRVETL